MDRRKSIDGLAVLVGERIEANPLSGHLFAFVSRRRDRVKLLAWDRNGFVLIYKRLEKGRFPAPATWRARA